MSKSVDLAATEDPTSRADLQTGDVWFGGRFLGSSLQFRLAGANSWALSHVVATLGAIIPPGLSLGICKAAGASTTETLWVCLVTLAASLTFTGYVQIGAARIRHQEKAERAARDSRGTRGARPIRRERSDNDEPSARAKRADRGSRTDGTPEQRTTGPEQPRGGKKPAGRPGSAPKPGRRRPKNR